MYTCMYNHIQCMYMVQYCNTQSYMYMYMYLFQELNSKAEGKFNRLKAQAKTKITTLNRELERLREEHGAPPLDISVQVCISIALLISYTRCILCLCIYRVSFRGPLATVPHPPKRIVVNIINKHMSRYYYINEFAPPLFLTLMFCPLDEMSK